MNNIFIVKFINLTKKSWAKTLLWFVFNKSIWMQKCVIENFF